MQTTLRQVGCWIALLFALNSADAAEPEIKLPPKENFHLYLLIGQSNMAGRGKIEEQDQVPHPRVLKLTKDNTWAPGLDPLHFDKPQIAGVGLGSSFGQAMADADPDVTIGLIPCAVGGTPLARWQKDGDLYQQAVERAKVAMKDGTLKGILWHQGENDAGREETAKNYAERLSQMIADLRAEFGVKDCPFVAGKLGEFLARETKDGKPNYWPLVNEQLDLVPKRVRKALVISSVDLKHKGDGVHFDSVSLRELGNRYAKAMMGLQDPSKRPPLVERTFRPIYSRLLLEGRYGLPKVGEVVEMHAEVTGPGPPREVNSAFKVPNNFHGKILAQFENATIQGDPLFAMSEVACLKIWTKDGEFRRICVFGGAQCPLSFSVSGVRCILDHEAEDFLDESVRFVDLIKEARKESEKPATNGDGPPKPRVQQR